MVRPRGERCVARVLVLVSLSCLVDGHPVDSQTSPSPASESPKGEVAPGEEKGRRMTAGAASHEATLGDKELKGGNAQKAMAHYNKALELDDSNAEIYIKRATGYMVTGKTSKANKDLDLALTLDPQNLKAILKRARVRRQQGLFDDAVADYEAAGAIEPGNAKVAKELPQVAQARKAQDQGRQSFEKAVAALDSGDSTNAKRLFGQAHFNLGNALKAAPDSPDNLAMDARVRHPPHLLLTESAQK
jgi:Tfp pilus assembly protein PilF